MFKSLKDFIAIVKRSNLRGDTIVKIPLANALDMESELATLLLELKEKNTNWEQVFDGGKFKT